MDEFENEIINSTKEFAAFNNIHFDELTQSMVLNAIRETKQKLNIHSVMQAEGSDGAEGAAVGKEREAKGVSVEICECYKPEHYSTCGINCDKKWKQNRA